MKKLFIFDLDGVLVDACEWHKIALNNALERVAKYQITDIEHKETFNGIPTRKKLQILAGRGIITSDQVEEIYNLKQSLTVDAIISNAKLRQEKVEMIIALREAGYIVTCFTNSIKQTAHLMLQKTGVYDLLEMIVTNQDVVEPKPSPEGYNKIIDYYGVDRENVYIVEDSPKGVQAAKATTKNVFVVKGPNEVDIDLIKEIL
tara:strand:- start:7925 stop:8533 length:609 start_codon:yes stop_codon:yes gene_type:complete